MPRGMTNYFLQNIFVSSGSEKIIDVIELFGIDRLAVLLEQMGGSKIEFPTWKTIDNLLVDSYLMWKMDTPMKDEEFKSALSEELGATYESLESRVEALQTTLKNFINQHDPLEPQINAVVKSYQEFKEALEDIGS